MKRGIVSLVMILLLSGCNPGSEVKVNTSGIFEPILFAVNNQDADGKTLDLGEHILSSDPISLKVRIYNETEFPYTDIDIMTSADGDFSPSISFNPTPTGEINFPGHLGTCGRILLPKTACFVELLLAPREERSYREFIKLVFKNYVEAEEHTGTLLLLAGMPASLVFTNDKTQYTFGDLIGQNKLPVVEREDAIEYSENLELVNAGGLSAKNLTVTLSQNCISTLTNECPADMNGAFTTFHNCPSKLMPGEKCNIQVKYNPKNQDPTTGTIPEDIKEINYRSTINMVYVKDPTGATGALNGYFRSISTNIEARFKVAQANLNFEAPIISGNRDLRTFRINNLGYREGEIRALSIRDSGGALLGTCRAKTGSAILDCFSSSGNLLTLADLPFRFKDRDNCLNNGAEEPVYVPVGSGCVFDLIFQPSVSYLTNIPNDFQNLQPEVIYDSRWKGQEKIDNKKIFNLSASSLAAGRLVPDKFQYAGISYPITGSAPGIIDLGRIALQSPSFFKYKPIILSFKNVGGTPASGLSIKDGLNRIIPIGGTTVKLGAKSPYYYNSVLGSDSNCAVVAPGENCTISMIFAPIGMNTNEEENDNMFDIMGDDGKRYKTFSISYDSGAKFTDTNLEGEPDYTSEASTARVRATLLRKGLLMQLADDTRNLPTIGGGVSVTGDTAISYIYLRNIGTGPIPYIRLLNQPITNSTEVLLESTNDPQSLGADHDCLTLVDSATTDVVSSNATPNSRVGNFQQLEKDRSCVYTVRTKLKDFRRRANATSCNNTLPTATNLEEGVRFFSKDLSGLDMWEFCVMNFGMEKQFNFFYYDGDLTDPALPPGSTDGNKLTLPTFGFRSQMVSPAKLILNSFEPEFTATLYRPQIDYPYVAGTSLSTTSIPERWFYGSTASFFHNFIDPLNTSPFIKGNESRNFVSTLAAFTEKSNYDYILYLGSFPQGTATINFPLSLSNYGGFRATFKSLNLVQDPSFTTVSLPASAIVAPLGVATPFSFNFSPSIPGENRMVVNFSYANGRHTDPLYFERSLAPANNPGDEIVHQKILVVANVEPADTYPYLSLNVSDYEVVEIQGSTPQETLGSSYPAQLSWNTEATKASLLFDTIKLTSTPKTSDTYAKKILTFTNSSAFPIHDLRPLYRAGVKSSVIKNATSTFKSVTGTTCTPGMTLNSGSSCNLVLWYQPISSDSSDNFVLSMQYRLGTGRYTLQNVEISLLPRSPGQLVAEGINTEPISYKVSPTSTAVSRFSYPLNLGTRILDVVPKALNFDQPSGGLKKIKFKNTQTTKASLLLAYQRYLSANNLRGFSASAPAPSFVIPDSSEYRDHSDGEKYVVINLNTYTGGAHRVRVEASKGCLFGDDENNASIPSNRKGFNISSVTPCFVLFYFNANFEYLKKTILSNNGDDMRGTASELWYYSVNRSSTASAWVHIKGIINPDPSSTVGNFDNVVALENRTASFKVPKFTPNNLDLGDVVGIRVLLGTSSTSLNDPYDTKHKYVDVRPYNPSIDQFALFNSNLLNGQYFWFRAIPIRRDTRFIDGTPKRFVGLNAGEYLSASTNLLKTLVPPVNHYWFHNQRALVEKTLTGGVTYSPYLTASNRCTATTKTVILKSPTNVTYRYRLITLPIWDLLMVTPGANAYANMSQTPHWTSDPLVSIDAKCSALPGFIPGINTQTLSTSNVFYLRNSSSPNASVNTVVGGIPGANFDNFTSYINGAVGFASSRCMVLLPP